jgi:uncharacterized protein YndB with AHSA1/START domain
VIKIHTIVSVPLEKVWEIWTPPEHVEKGDHASYDWVTPKAENDLRTGCSQSHQSVEEYKNRDYSTGQSLDSSI